MKPPLSAVLHKWEVALFALLKPFGAWGIGALAVIDSAAIPIPIDALLIDYVVHDHAKFVLYCFMAGLGSAVGSLLPFYLGRAGGELFLLKRINRKRYEQLRDRFERQEFLAIMIPAMMPPPMPVKLFEFAAGVFEMKTVWFFSAILVGKFIRFMIWAVITILFGPAIFHTVIQTVRAHMGYVMGIGGILAVLLGVWVVRKLFDRRRGTRFPLEEDAQR
ncbi:YqaA family protein [Edaphobacter aggregans]|uniref:YqaA family protein n=1 Tax=Edaphobacter aggregans TaxID=570835 RepID=UPI000554E377|nr:VTT domain-containing protein [Edaphobacter aggregans]